MTLPVFVGYDKSEQDAFDVCIHSLARHSTVPLHIQPLDQDALRRAGLYRRAPTPGTWEDRDDKRPFSTDFTFSRFLVPALCQWKGWALFVDCDFLFTKDIAELLEHYDPHKAVHVVQHNYRPEPGEKMEGRRQEPYVRKNWSSLILWNCAHPSNKSLTVDVVNLETGRYLHGFGWLDYDDIGELPREWNWLEGHYPGGINPLPAAIHYTRGGPWFEQWQYVDYAQPWRDELERMKL